MHGLQTIASSFCCILIMHLLTLNLPTGKAVVRTAVVLVAMVKQHPEHSVSIKNDIARTIYISTYFLFVVIWLHAGCRCSIIGSPSPFRTVKAVPIVEY